MPVLAVYCTYRITYFCSTWDLLLVIFNIVSNSLKVECVELDSLSLVELALELNPE